MIPQNKYINYKCTSETCVTKLVLDILKVSACLREEKRPNLDELYMSPCRLVFCWFSTQTRTHARTCAVSTSCPPMHAYAPMRFAVEEKKNVAYFTIAILRFIFKTYLDSLSSQSDNSFCCKPRKLKSFQDENYN